MTEQTRTFHNYANVYKKVICEKNITCKSPVRCKNFSLLIPSWTLVDDKGSTIEHMYNYIHS